MYGVAGVSEEATRQSLTGMSANVPVPEDQLLGRWTSDKAETGKKGIRSPTAEGLFLEGECNRH